MPPTCTICRHVQRQAIDADLVAGIPYRHIAARTGTSTGALQRHKAACLSATLVKATEAAEVRQADVLLAKARGIEAEARRLGRKAEREGDLRAALLAVRELGRICELMGRLAGAFQPETALGGLHYHLHLDDLASLRTTPQAPETQSERLALRAEEGGCMSAG